MQSVLFLALGAIVQLSAAQVVGPAQFANMNWSAGFTEGGEYDISWTSTDANPVSANLVSGNYSQPIFVNEVLGSPYQWTVPAVAAGTYTMQLLDDGVLSDTSPSFQITSVALPPDLGNGTDGTSTSSMMSTGSSAPVTTVYWDEGCTCHKTAVVTAAAYASASAYASAGAGAGTGAEASAAAGAGAGSCAGSGCGSGSNWTAPMTTPSMSTYMPSGNGAAERLSGCMGAALAFVLIAFIA